MARTYYLKGTDSDLTGGADFSKALEETTGTLASQSISIAANATEVSRAFTPSGEPGVSGVTGDYVVNVALSVSNMSVLLAVQLHRVNSAGTIQNSSSISAEQTTAATLQFSFPAQGLGTWAAGDRLRVDYRFRNSNTMSAQSVDIDYNTSGGQVDTPFLAVITGSGVLASDVSTAAGSGTVTSAITGSGTLASGASTVDGSGVAEWIASGDLQSAASTVSGSGASSSTGSGGPTASSSTLNGSGISSSTGSGDLTASSATLDGAGAAAWVGSGALTSAVSTVDGSGTVANAEVTFVASATHNEANPTTDFTITIPAETQEGNVLFMIVSTRGSVTPTVSDDDTGGNSWTRLVDTTATTGNLYYKRATANTGGKTVSVSGLSNSASGVLMVFSGPDTGEPPHANVSKEANSSLDKTHAGFTPSAAGSMICFANADQTNDDLVSNVACTDPGAMTTVTATSIGGGDCSAAMSYARQTGGPNATGDFTWTQNASATTSFVWEIKTRVYAAGDITGSGAITAQASTVDGTGISLSTGSGALSAQASTIDGAGASGSAGTGTLTAQSATADGAGTSSSTGSGALTAGSASLDGAGTSESTGSGALSAQASVVDGSGTAEGGGITGSGAASSQASTLDGTGTSSSTGAGALAAGNAAADGAGVSSSTGSGSLDSAASSVDGAGAVGSNEVTGSGSLIPAASVASGAGMAAWVGSGGLDATAASVDGSGAVSSEGSGVLAPGSSSVAGAGVTGSIGTGDVQAQSSQADGAGVSSSAGSGSLESGNSFVQGRDVEPEFVPGRFSEEWKHPRHKPNRR
jgi:hypothetical protein